MSAYLLDGRRLQHEVTSVAASTLSPLLPVRGVMALRCVTVVGLEDVDQATSWVYWWLETVLVKAVLNVWQLVTSSVVVMSQISASRSSCECL